MNKKQNKLCLNTGQLSDYVIGELACFNCNNKISGCPDILCFAAANAGWRVTKSGNLLCPNCKRIGSKPKKNKFNRAKAITKFTERWTHLSHKELVVANTLIYNLQHSIGELPTNMVDLIALTHPEILT